MAEWGIMTWDAGGKRNNTGLVPTSVLGYVPLQDKQLSGAWSFTIPAGLALKFIFIPNSGDTSSGNNWRKITISGGTASISESSSSAGGPDFFPGVAGWLIFYAG